MIPLPSKPQIIERKSDNLAIFQIEPLYPGYGVTIGNSMRRVLLSSLGGAAITKVKIEGVGHEFSTIPGVMEDVVEIILNLKELRFIAHSKEEQSARLKVKGEKEVQGSSLELPTQIELVNPNQHIATLTGKSSALDMEVKIETGIGYDSAKERKEEKLDIGQIVIDTIFTPIRHANFWVESMRVEKRTDFDRLFLEVGTDGTISPEDAFIKASDILVQHFSLLSSFGKSEKKSEKETIKEDKKQDEEWVIDDLEISARNANILKENKIKTTKGLVKKSESDLLSLQGMGEKGIEEIKKSLKKRGLALKES